LSFLRLYPYNADRTSAFLLPAFFLLIAAGLESVWLLPVTRVTSRRWLTAYALAGVLIAIPDARETLSLASLRVNYQQVHREDVRSAVATIREQAGPRDLVYAHPSVAEQTTLYLKMNGGYPGPVEIGAGSWPCCALKQYVMRSPGAEAVLDDFESAAKRSASGRVWFVYTDRAEHWRFSGADDRAAVLEGLPSIGCQEEQAYEFHGVGMSEIRCGPPVAEASGPR
jgi:hypothetical protein